MQKRKTGAIVNITSLASLFPLPGLPLYSGAKAGLSHTLRTLQLLNNDPNIIWIDFQPGDFRTEFNSSTLRRDTAGHSATQSAWQGLEKHLQAGTHPETAARDLIRVLQRGKSCTCRSGNIFQTTLAPLALRILPQSLFIKFLRRYYNLRSG